MAQKFAWLMRTRCLGGPWRGGGAILEGGICALRERAGRNPSAGLRTSPPFTGAILATRFATAWRHRMHPLSLRLAAASLLLVLAGAVGAADVTTSKADDKLSPARARIAEKNWSGAVDELKKVNDPANADWNNLMGYSLRKADAANIPEAEKYYNEALRIEPKHRGALEYSGELYLMIGNLDKAEQRLAALDKVCFLPCEEHSDLKRAVARYKAAGNKYVPY
jgi:tetratricopeptide (TPR) repeat protein